MVEKMVVWWVVAMAALRASMSVAEMVVEWVVLMDDARVAQLVDG